MATASAAKEAKPTAKATAQVQVSAPSRREFLYYIWGASFALLLGETTAGLLWFIFPRFKEGEFGGTFNFDIWSNTLFINIAPSRCKPSGNRDFKRTTIGQRDELLNTALPETLRTHKRSYLIIA